MYNLLYIIPILGMVFAAVFAFFIIKQKINEYDYKITSIFSLLSAITDEITKIKNPNSYNKPVFISDDLNSTTNFENQEQDDELESENDSENESDDDENDEHQEDDSDEDDFDDEDDEEDIQVQEISNNVEEEILKNLEEKKDTDKQINIDLEPVDYQNMTVKQLRDLAKQRGLKGDLTKLKRSDLIDSLENKDIKI